MSGVKTFEFREQQLSGKSQRLGLYLVITGPAPALGDASSLFFPLVRKCKHIALGIPKQKT